MNEAAAAGEITLARFRDLAGVGRRDAQLLLERMDVDGVTRRVGDRLSFGAPLAPAAETPGEEQWLQRLREEPPWQGSPTSRKRNGSS